MPNNPLYGPIISVEDDEDDQQFIAMAVKQLGISNKLLFFPNGEEALTYLETTHEQPLLILCDINMPLMNGLELRRRLNQSVFLRNKSVPFIYLTTSVNTEAVQVADEEAAQGLCLKAHSYDAFKEQIRIIVDYWKSSFHVNSVLTAHC